jgi:hypothetical protein
MVYNKYLGLKISWNLIVLYRLICYWLYIMYFLYPLSRANWNIRKLLDSENVTKNLYLSLFILV